MSDPTEITDVERDAVSVLVDGGWAEPWSAAHIARALAAAGLLPTEVEWVTTDLMGDPEPWNGVFDNREEAEMASDSCGEAPVYRYVTPWQEVVDRNSAPATYPTTERSSVSEVSGDD